MALLEADGLTVTARLGGADVAVLRDITFALEPGRVLCLIGESGAGKSMLGRVIASALPEGFVVGGGHLRFAGEDLVAMAGERRRGLLGDRIAFIPQEPLSALNPVQTIAAQFGEHLARLGLPRAGHRERIVAALGEVRLDRPASLLGRYPFELSGGMCQRVLIAMAFASRPALIIADEPTTALDVSTQATVVQIIRRLQREHGTALLFITHDLRLAARVADEIVVLYAGEVVERAPARIISLSPRHPYTRALKAASPPLSGAIRRLATLPDHMPGLAAMAAVAGCRFAPRCPVRDAACAASRPGLVAVAAGHWVRCTPACAAAKAEAADAGVVARARDAPPPLAQAGAAILAIEQLAKHYPARRTLLQRAGAGVDAVRPLDLAVRAGEFVGVVGESGSGKSTLAKLIMGLEVPSGGRVLIDGIPVAFKGGERIRLGALQMVFQDPQSALNPRRPVERLITQALDAGGARAALAGRQARARALLAETGLPPELLDRYPAQLSGGQKQRVNIARALCVTPRLLVADEIVSGLDVSVQAQILNLLVDLRAERGFGMLFISHDLAVVRYLCSRLIVMRGGAVVERGETEAVFSSPQHAYTRALLAAVPPEDLDALWPIPEA